MINTFPNPINDELIVTVNNKKTIDVLEIYSIEGKLIYSQKCKALEIKLDLKELTAGTYLLKMQQGELVSYKKIMKL